MNLYDIALGLIALAAAPKYGVQALFHSKYRKSWKQRFGFGIEPIQPSAKKTVWIHAVSVGETKAVSALAEKLKKDGDCRLIVSSITETGHAEAVKSIPQAERHLYLPLDFSWFIRPFVRRINPDFVLISETDLWYNFLDEAKRGGARIALVNGKLSERSMKRYGLFPSLSNRLFSLIDHFILQNLDYHQRFKQLGIPEEKLSVSGNMKLDVQIEPLTPSEKEWWRKRLAIPENVFVVVAGSTHEGEEELILNAFLKGFQKRGEAKLILVPRHPERFSRVARLLQARQIAYSRYTEGVAPGAEVILLDAMGVLQNCYQVADLAIVGGSFVKRTGGHNIIEPSFFGVPVIHGPCMSSQPDLKRLAADYGSAVQVEETDLAACLQDLFLHPQHRKTLSENGLKLVKDQSYATEKAVEILQRKMFACAKKEPCAIV